MFIASPEKNRKITEQIEKMLSSDRQFHAYLFTGGNADSRNEIAMWLSSKIICHDDISYQKFIHGNCEDFIVLEKPEDKETINKDQVMALMEKLEFKPFGDKYVVFIKDAHLINEIAQNKLLKCIEEPTSQTVFIFMSEREDALLSTIRSRCTSFSLEEEDTISDDVTDKAADLFAGLICGKPGFYRKKAVITYILNDKENSRALALTFLEVLEDKLEKGMLSGNMYHAKAIEYVERARMYLKQGQSVPYTMKQLCLMV